MSAEERVGIFWDYDTCKLTSNVSGYEASRHIRDIAHRYGSVTSFKMYTSLSKESEQLSEATRAELQTSGVSISEFSSNIPKGVGDQMISTDVLAFVLDSLPLASTIIWLTGNPEFIYTVSMLRLRKHRVILIGPSSSKTLHFSGAGTCWLSWDSEVLHQREPAEKNSPSPRGSPSHSPSSRSISADATPMGASPVGTPQPTQPTQSASPTLNRISPPRLNGSTNNTLNSPFYPSNGTFQNSASMSNGFGASFNMTPASSHSTPFSSFSPLRPNPGLSLPSPSPPQSLRHPEMYPPPSSLTISSPLTYLPGSSGLPGSQADPPIIPRNARYFDTDDILKHDRRRSLSILPVQNLPIGSGSPTRTPGGSGSSSSVFGVNHPTALTSSWPSHHISPPSRLATTSTTSSSTIVSPLRAPPISTHSPVVSNTRRSIVPAAFQPLVQTLEHRRNVYSDTRPLRSVVGQNLSQALYKSAGVESFKEYVLLAEKEGIVELGGVNGHAWISLK